MADTGTSASNTTRSFIAHLSEIGLLLSLAFGWCGHAPAVVLATPVVRSWRSRNIARRDGAHGKRFRDFRSTSAQVGYVVRTVLAGILGIGFPLLITDLVEPGTNCRSVSAYNYYARPALASPSCARSDSHLHSTSVERCGLLKTNCAHLVPTAMQPVPQIASTTT